MTSELPPPKRLLYALPFACSLAPHLALEEAGEPYEIAWMTRERLRQSDYRRFNPKGKVPALVDTDGSVITENAAVLLHVADGDPRGELAPPVGSPSRIRLHEWLSYVSTEIHKQVLFPHFDLLAPAATKADVVARLLPPVLAYPEQVLSTRPYLLGETFSAADAYLFWTLWLVPRLGVELGAYPALTAYLDRVKGRPAARRTLADERRGLDGAAP